MNTSLERLRHRMLEIMLKFHIQAGARHNLVSVFARWRRSALELWQEVRVLFMGQRDFAAHCPVGQRVVVAALLVDLKIGPGASISSSAKFQHNVHG